MVLNFCLFVISINKVTTIKRVIPLNITYEDAVSYRTPLIVEYILVFENGDAFPICPRCSVTIERDYQRYCDRCGQRLNWHNYHKAKIIYWGTEYKATFHKPTS